MSENVPERLKEIFSHYGYAGFLENFENQMKARYCYMTRNYPPLFSYIEEMKKRESYLLGYLELLAMEACIHYKMKNREKACAVLTEAYETAAPNDLLMPFIELGKDMRTLTSYALKEHSLKGNSLSKSAHKIPIAWLESVNRKSASYAKRLSHVIAKHKQAAGITDNVYISPREKQVLIDLSHGLSRSEIAASRNLSINTIKMVINNLYSKLGAENLADTIRIATQSKII